MAPRYAEGTSVPVEKTRIEIEEVLRRFRADSFVSGYEGRTAFIAFRARYRMVRLTLEMPDPTDAAFALTEAGRARTEGAAAAYEAECRRRWRSLGLLVKAKVAAVADCLGRWIDDIEDVATTISVNPITGSMQIGVVRRA